VRDSVAIRGQADRIVRLSRDAARAELDQLLDSAKAYPVSSSSRRVALDYNAHLVTAVREAYERLGRKSCWADA
jgi:hypothetical protein